MAAGRWQQLRNSFRGLCADRGAARNQDRFYCVGAEPRAIQIVAARGIGNLTVHGVAGGIPVSRGLAESAVAHIQESMGGADRGIGDFRPLTYSSQAVSKLEVRDPGNDRWIVLRARVHEGAVTRSRGARSRAGGHFVARAV